jgi:hypothetical protein
MSRLNILFSLDMVTRETISAHLLGPKPGLRIRNSLISFNESNWSLQLHGKLIKVNKDPWFGRKEPVNILKGPTALLVLPLG